MIKPEPSSKASCYEIKIKGKLDDQWLGWFNGMVISSVQSDDEFPETTLTALVPDQARLRGILNKIWDLNLTLIAIRQYEPDRDEDE